MESRKKKCAGESIVHIFALTNEWKFGIQIGGTSLEKTADVSH